MHVVVVATITSEATRPLHCYSTEHVTCDVVGFCQCSTLVQCYSKSSSCVCFVVTSQSSSTTKASHRRRGRKHRTRWWRQQVRQVSARAHLPRRSRWCCMTSPLAAATCHSITATCTRPCRPRAAAGRRRARRARGTRRRRAGMTANTTTTITTSSRYNSSSCRNSCSRSSGSSNSRQRFPLVKHKPTLGLESSRNPNHSGVILIVRNHLKVARVPLKIKQV